MTVSGERVSVDYRHLTSGPVAAKRRLRRRCQLCDALVAATFEGRCLSCQVAEPSLGMPGVSGDPSCGV